MAERRTPEEVRAALAKVRAASQGPVAGPGGEVSNTSSNPSSAEAGRSGLLAQPAIEGERIGSESPALKPTVPEGLTPGPAARESLAHGVDLPQSAVVSSLRSEASVSAPEDPQSPSSSASVGIERPDPVTPRASVSPQSPTPSAGVSVSEHSNQSSTPPEMVASGESREPEVPQPLRLNVSDEDPAALPEALRALSVGVAGRGGGEFVLEGVRDLAEAHRLGQSVIEGLDLPDDVKKLIKAKLSGNVFTVVVPSMPSKIEASPADSGRVEVSTGEQNVTVSAESVPEPLANEESGNRQPTIAELYDQTRQEMFGDKPRLDRADNIALMSRLEGVLESVVVERLNEVSSEGEQQLVFADVSSPIVAQAIERILARQPNLASEAVSTEGGDLAFRVLRGTSSPEEAVPAPSTAAVEAEPEAEGSPAELSPEPVLAESPVVGPEPVSTTGAVEPAASAGPEGGLRPPAVDYLRRQFFDQHPDLDHVGRIWNEEEIEEYRRAIEPAVSRELGPLTEGGGVQTLEFYIPNGNSRDSTVIEQLLQGQEGTASLVRRSELNPADGRVVFEIDRLSRDEVSYGQNLSPEAQAARAGIMERAQEARGLRGDELVDHLVNEAVICEYTPREVETTLLGMLPREEREEALMLITGEVDNRILEIEGQAEASGSSISEQDQRYIRIWERDPGYESRVKRVSEILAKTSSKTSAQDEEEERERRERDARIRATIATQSGTGVSGLFKKGWSALAGLGRKNTIAEPEPRLVAPEASPHEETEEQKFDRVFPIIMNLNLDNAVSEGQVILNAGYALRDGGNPALAEKGKADMIRVLPLEIDAALARDDQETAAQLIEAARILDISRKVPELKDYLEEKNNQMNPLI